MKSAWQAGMSLEALILRIQLYIPAFLLPAGAFNGCYDKLCTTLIFDFESYF